MCTAHSEPGSYPSDAAGPGRLVWRTKQADGVLKDRAPAEGSAGRIAARESALYVGVAHGRVAWRVPSRGSSAHASWHTTSSSIDDCEASGGVGQSWLKASIRIEPNESPQPWTACTVVEGAGEAERNFPFLGSSAPAYPSSLSVRSRTWKSSPCIRIEGCRRSKSTR